MATAGTGATLAAPATVVHFWPREPASVPQARHALRAALAAWGLSALTDEAEVVLTELVTNAVQHCGTGDGRIETRCSPLPRRAAGVRLEVHDGDAAQLPVLGRPADEGVRGRGLQIVDAVARHMWGVTMREGRPGKVVWAHVGGDVDDVAPYCEASARLGPGLVGQVLALGERVAPDLVADPLLCFFEAGHVDGHVALAYDHLDGADAGAVWARWEDGEARARTVCVLPDCPSPGPGDAGGCSLFTGHPGRHTWEWAG